MLIRFMIILYQIHELMCIAANFPKALSYTVVPSFLSGHSQQRSLYLMWPKHFYAATMNAFTSPSHQRPPLYVAIVSWQLGWPY